jgi:hypothetical protein
MTLLRHFFYSPHMSVPDTIVKQIAEGRPVVLALLCSGLRTYYRPAAGDLPPGAFQLSEIAAPYVRGGNPEVLASEKPDFGPAAISPAFSASPPPGPTSRGCLHAP